jgi:hypothetical protein
MSNSSEKQLVVDTLEFHEEHIIVRFDVPKIQGAPWTGMLILRQLGFNVVTIIKVSLDEAQARNIVVELMHNGFCTRAQA